MFYMLLLRNSLQNIAHSSNVCTINSIIMYHTFNNHFRMAYKSYSLQQSGISIRPPKIGFTYRSYRVHGRELDYLITEQFIKDNQALMSILFKRTMAEIQVTVFIL